MATANYGLQAPNTGLGLRAPAPVNNYSSLGGYGYQPQPLNYDWNTSQMGGYGFQEGAMGGYGLQANGAQIPTPNLTGGAPQVGGGAGGDWSWLGNRNQQGMAGVALGGVQALGGLYLGMQQYNLAKDSLAFQKDSFNKQYETNKTLTNSQLEDRQKARVASNAGAYQSVGDYMNQNGVK